jgi:poly(A) polymerase
VTAPGRAESSAEAEDALRVAVGIAAGRAAPPVEAVPAGAVEVEGVPKGRIRDLMQRLLTASKPEPALQWLHDCGLLAAILPELEATVDFTQEMGRRHKDVWKHTKQVVAQAEPEPAIRWAALLHDIGKVPTRTISPTGKVAFHGHAEVGARMFDRIAARLELPDTLRNRVRFLIQHHLRANQYDGSWTDSAVRRFDREMGEHLESLLSLSRADITSARRQKREAALAQIDELVGRIQALREIDARVPPLPSGLGNVIMERFGLGPGRIIGELRRELELVVEAGGLEPHREADYYLEYLDGHRQELGIPEPE